MRNLRFAFRQTIPIFFTYLFIGIAFGIMMAEAGYGPFWSVLSSLFTFAGSLQIVMVSLLRAGVPLVAVAVMTLFINGRHIFYGIGLIERFRKMGWRMPYMVFALTDETYSILCSLRYEEGVDPIRADFLIALLNQCYWVFGTLIGSVAGKLLPFDMRGIDFSATAFFLVVVVDQWRRSGSKLPSIVGVCSALIFYLLLGPDRFLIPALAVGTVLLVILRDRIERKKGADGA